MTIPKIEPHQAEKHFRAIESYVEQLPSSTAWDKKRTLQIIYALHGYLTESGITIDPTSDRLLKQLGIQLC